MPAALFALFQRCAYQYILWALAACKYTNVTLRMQVLSWWKHYADLKQDMWCNTCGTCSVTHFSDGIVVKALQSVLIGSYFFFMSFFLKLGCYHTCLTSKYFTTPLCSSSQDPKPFAMFPVFHLFPLTLSLRTPHLMLVCDVPVIPLFHSYNQLRELCLKLIFR